MPRGWLEKRKIREKLEDEEAFATSLLALCLDAYGTEVFDWDPRTLWISLSEDYGVDLPSINKDKIQALTLAYTTNLPYVSVEAFNHVCNVLSGSEANFRVWDLLSPEEALWGIYEMSLNVAVDREKDEEPPEFSHEVRLYLGTILENDGIFDPPDILRVAEFRSAESGLEQLVDDPVLFNAVYDKQKTDKADLLEFLGRRLLALMQELSDLPLQDRDPEQWAQFRQAVESKARKLVEEHTSAVSTRT